MSGYPSFYDDEIPEDCAECGTPLPETNGTGFCCSEHESIHVERQRAADNAYAEAIAAERGLHEALRFEIPDRLIPSTAMGLAMTQHFCTTPPSEFV